MYFSVTLLLATPCQLSRKILFLDNYSRVPNNWGLGIKGGLEFLPYIINRGIGIIGGVGKIRKKIKIF